MFEYTASELATEWAGPGKVASGFLHVLALVAFLLNCTAFVSYRDIRKPTVLFLRNLAVADGITAVAFPPAYWIPPYAIVDICSEEYGCFYFLAHAVVLCFTAFSFTGVVGLVLNQTLANVSPFRYRGSWSQAKRIICIVILWILPPLFLILTIMYGFFLHKDTQNNQPFCEFVSTRKVKRFGKILWVAAALLALLVVVAMYVKVYFVARRVFAGRRMEQKEEMKRNLRAVKTTVVILVCLLACWVPIVVCMAVRTNRLSRTKHSLVVAILWTWTLVNSIASPIIVIVRMKQVRNAYKNMFKRKRATSPKGSSDSHEHQSSMMTYVSKDNHWIWLGRDMIKSCKTTLDLHLRRLRFNCKSFPIFRNIRILIRC